MTKRFFVSSLGIRAAGIGLEVLDFVKEDLVNNKALESKTITVGRLHRLKVVGRSDFMELKDSDLTAIALHHRNEDCSHQRTPALFLASRLSRHLPHFRPNQHDMQHLAIPLPKHTSPYTIQFPPTKCHDQVSRPQTSKFPQ